MHIFAIGVYHSFCVPTVPIPSRVVRAVEEEIAVHEIYCPVLNRIELIFFLGTGTMLWFGLRLRQIFTTYRCLFLSSAYPKLRIFQFPMLC